MISFLELKLRKGLIVTPNWSNLSNRVPLVVEFHPALKEINGIGTAVKESNGNLSKVKRDRDVCIGMSRCNKKRRKICNHVEEGKEFFEEEVKCYINYNFNCDSAELIYLIYCGKCGKKYVGSTITSFRKRSSNHKSSMNRYGRGERGMAGAWASVRSFF